MKSAREAAGIGKTVASQWRADDAAAAIVTAGSNGVIRGTYADDKGDGLILSCSSMWIFQMTPAVAQRVGSPGTTITRRRLGITSEASVKT
jgi:hypothetical protein